MNSLLDVQSRFSQSVMNNGDDVKSWLTESEIPGLEIYNNAYRIRLLETLTQDYPALKQFMGEQSFETMASQFIQEYPSASFTLRTFGEHLFDFLRTHKDYSQLTCLAELASFEWCLTDVFDVADTPVVGVEVMNQLQPQAWPGLSVNLHASIKWLTLKWNIGDIYPALKSRTDMPEIVINPNRHYFLIWRQNNSPHYRMIDHTEWLAIKIVESKNFSELCLMLSKSSDSAETAALQAATYLKSWLMAGLIESIKYENDED